MFDDLRQQGEKPLADFEQPEEEQPGLKRVARRRSRYAQTRFLGMTAPQRFVIAVMLLMMTCLLGTFCLLVTQRIVPPFLY